MGIQSFAIGECGDDRTEVLQAFRSDLLRCNVFLEG